MASELDFLGSRGQSRNPKDFKNHDLGKFFQQSRNARKNSPLLTILTPTYFHSHLGSRFPENPGLSTLFLSFHLCLYSAQYVVVFIHFCIKLCDFNIWNLMPTPRFIFLDTTSGVMRNSLMIILIMYLSRNNF